MTRYSNHYQLTEENIQITICRNTNGNKCGWKNASVHTRLTKRFDVVYQTRETVGAFFWDYSGIGILGIVGICVLLGAIPFSE